MTVQAKTIALVGKYNAAGINHSMYELAHFLDKAGHTVVLEAETAHYIQLDGVESMSVADIGKTADAAIVVGPWPDQAYTVEFVGLVRRSLFR